MPSARSVTCGLSLLLALGACAGARTEVNATAAPNVDFRDFKTFAFVPADRLDMAGSQMRDPVTRRNLETAIGGELQRKGLVPSTTTPDLLVAYFADVYEGVDKKQPENPDTSGARWERQGKLTIDLLQAATGSAVWHGEAWARDPNFQVAEKLVADLLQKYPAPR